MFFFFFFSLLLFLSVFFSFFFLTPFYQMLRRILTLQIFLFFYLTGVEARGGADGADGENHRQFHAASDQVGGRHRRSGLLWTGQSPADAGHGEETLSLTLNALSACHADTRCVVLLLPQVRVLFSKGPFISIFASDPHIIIKAINQNLNSVLRDSNINGHDYMRNIVHLPVFLNSRGLSSARKMCAAAPANGDASEGNRDYQSCSFGSWSSTLKVCVCFPVGWHEELDRKLSQHSLGELAKCGSKTTLNRRVSLGGGS